MPVETPSLFAQVIRDHLDLKERNAQLDHKLPIERYRNVDPFDNHPLFKTEEQARLEDTLDGVDAAVVADSPAMVAAWPGEETAEHSGAEMDSGLWSRSRDFDWGD